MNLKLLKMRYHNIRDFKDLELNFVNGGSSPYHISLVQMPNGTGKTTTITLLRKIISNGEFEKEDINSFKPTKFEADDGSFEADFLFDKKPFTIGLKIDYNESSHNYYHSKPSKEKGGKETGHWLPQKIKHVFSEPFVNLFVFDGELSKKLLNDKETKAEEAIKAIYFLDRLQGELNRIDDVCEERYNKASKDSKVKTTAGLQNIKTRKKTLTDILSFLETSIRELEERIEKDKQELDGKKSEKDALIKKYEDLLVESKTLENDIEALKAKRVEGSLNLIKHLRKPSLFSKVNQEKLKKLADQMSALKLPKSTSIEFFKELADGTHCICGREIDKKAKIKILKSAESFLSEEDISVQNALKSHLKALPDFSSAEQYVSEINELLKELRTKTQEQSLLKNQLDPKSREKAVKIEEDIRNLEKSIEDSKTNLDLIKTKDQEKTRAYGLTYKDNKYLCEQKLKDVTKEIREASDTVEFGKKSDLLKWIMEEIISQSLDLIKDSILKRSNDKLNKILGEEEVVISKIDRSIQIQGKKSVSEGQSLSVGYAFLSTLFEESLFNLPFVVDSPCVSMDVQVRREVAKIVPKLFEQMVVFIISSEREGFVQGLKSDASTQYYTVSKKKGAGEQGGVEVNSDIDYFMRFHSEEEDES